MVDIWLMMVIIWSMMVIIWSMMVIIWLILMGFHYMDFNIEVEAPGSESTRSSAMIIDDH